MYINIISLSFIHIKSMFLKTMGVLSTIQLRVWGFCPRGFCPWGFCPKGVCPEGGCPYPCSFIPVPSTALCQMFYPFTSYANFGLFQFSSK